MAKIDGERYGKVASELEIKGFPTLLLFVNGTSQAYTGGFSAEDIVVWVQKKTGTPIITVNSLDEARRFLNKYHTFVVGFFHKFEGTEYNEFVKAAKSDNEIQFVETSDRDVAKLLFPELKTSKVFIGLVKTEAERWTLQDGESVKLQIMIFSKADVFQNLTQPLEDLARKFKSKVAAFDNNLNSKYLLESDPSPSKLCLVTETDNESTGFENLVFARFDASVKEHAKLQVDDFPTILLYKSGQKEKPLKLSTK
ncbi:Protein disulfide isomerase-like 1-5 [Raphanus sativus]|nr:Protein disulfide isomerase-like 1-5 [Raphanus sativus]